MFLGIEIGGTKLQLGVGRGDGQLLGLERRNVVIAHGAQGILQQIREAAPKLIAAFAPRAVGFGFGGPVDPDRGRVVTSHQVDGWTGFPIAAWIRQQFGLPCALGNDADVAGLAEACYGAGRDADPVFYITVGTGIGGGLIIGRKIYRGSGCGAAEIGHLRPGIECTDSHRTVESLAAGPGIAASVRKLLADSADADDQRDLLSRASGNLQQLTARHVAEAAEAGNALAQAALARAARVLGWGVAQVITLASPQVVVLGGGVMLAPRPLFLRVSAVSRLLRVAPGGPRRGNGGPRRAGLGC
jgi:glucokinase